LRDFLNGLTKVVQTLVYFIIYHGKKQEVAFLFPNRAHEKLHLRVKSQFKSNIDLSSPEFLQPWVKAAKNAVKPKFTSTQL